MPTFDLLVAINGITIDVVGDIGSGEAWVKRLTGLRITGGGGSFTSPTEPWTCSFGLRLAPDEAHIPRTVTVAVRGPLPDASAPAWATGSSDVYYRVVFHGNIVTARHNILDGLVEFNAVDEMATLFSRRARLAASANTNPRAVLSAIETAHSLTISGETSFPNATTGGGYQIDAPAQHGGANGDYIRTALAGTGVNCHAEWDGPITSPSLLWRPDWYWADNATINVARRQSISIPKMWQLSYPELGYNFDEFNAYIQVDGTDSAGTRRWGDARIHAAADRLSLGHREVRLDSWLDTATQCRLAAKHLLSRVGFPTQSLPIRVDVNVDHFAGPGLSGVGDSTYRLTRAWGMATAMLGDTIVFETAAMNPTTFQDPAPYVTDDVENMLDLIRAATIGEPDWSTTTTNAYAIRWLSRAWHPSTGWTLELGLQPDSDGYTVDTADTDSGTYA